MSKSSAKKTEEILENYDFEDTIPMPALDRLLKASEKRFDAMGRYSAGDTVERVLLAHLFRLVEMSESIDKRLEKLAELLSPED